MCAVARRSWSGSPTSASASSTTGSITTASGQGTEQREGFLLYPAEPWPHKNHARLFEAFARLRAERPGLELVLTGTASATFRRECAPLGRVAWEELPALYRRAAALVFPSLYEGFGLPPLEAMACGCPVACSSAASLPEVCGEAAVYFDPDVGGRDGRGGRQALEGELVQKGLEQAARFTWEASARGHDAAYSELLAGERPGYVDRRWHGARPPRGRATSASPRRTRSPARPAGARRSRRPYRPEKLSSA